MLFVKEILQLINTMMIYIATGVESTKAIRIPAWYRAIGASGLTLD